MLSEAVAASFFLRRGGRIIKHHYKTAYAEIDLWVEWPSGRERWIEVKSISDENWALQAISEHQVQRINRAWTDELARNENLIGLDLVLVDPNWTVEWFENGFLDLIG
ncbi:MAG: YraN family protein [Bdellovibrionales bacterium]|nr:YraN family protein [Bdellovibrionales bacterium]